MPKRQRADAYESDTHERQCAGRKSKRIENSYFQIGDEIEFKSSDPKYNGWKRGIVEDILEWNQYYTDNIRIRVGNFCIIRETKKIRLVRRAADKGRIDIKDLEYASSGVELQETVCSPLGEQWI